jgi:MFS family permease
MAATPQSASAPDAQPSAGSGPAVGGPYASYVLGVLVLVYVFNFIDRQILSILAEQIKADLGLSDAQIGFLYGTAFAVFYAVFGIPLGRLADVWTRKSLISIGLSFWSAMTALSGTARSFATLGAYRIGVGIGEASASPAAFSLLSDYFPPRLRATVLSIYSSGVYIGAGIGIFLGGVVSDSWNEAYVAGGAPFGLVGWQAAFFVVGLPGLLMALWVATLREPVRGQSEGIVTPAELRPFRVFGAELTAVLPLLSLWSLWQAGRSVRVLALNLAAGAGLALGAWGLTEVLGTPAQWIALAIGVYAAVSWIQGLTLRDPATFAMIFGSRALLYGVGGFSFLAFSGYGLGFWTAPFFLRVHGVSATEAGTVLGLTVAVCGWFGVTLGGVVSDWLRRRTPNARLWVGLVGAVVPVPVAIGLLSTDQLWLAYVFNGFLAVFAAMWIGPAATTVNDMVMPRMRAIASAFYILVITFIGLALGPYAIGRLSVALEAGGGTEAGEALRLAMLFSLGVNALAFVLLALACRHLPREEASRLERARAAGEPV